MHSAVTVWNALRIWCAKSIFLLLFMFWCSCMDGKLKVFQLKLSLWKFFRVDTCNGSVNLYVHSCIMLISSWKIVFFKKKKKNSKLYTLCSTMLCALKYTSSSSLSYHIILCGCGTFSNVIHSTLYLIRCLYMIMNYR